MRSFLLFVFAALACLATASGAAQFDIAKNGKPTCSIVIAEKPSYNAKAAAEELQQYVEKISGARLEIKTDSESISGPKILVGRSKLTDSIAGLKIPDGITIDLKEEGYVIRCAGDTLVLAGNDTEVTDDHEAKIRCNPGDQAVMGDAMYLGTRYAVYDLLNRFGVRWFMPGVFGEVVPKKDTLSVAPMSVEERPDFALRTFGVGIPNEQDAHDYTLWLIHNRMNPRSIAWFGVVADGTITNLMPKKELKTHPEWFAMLPDGSRNPNEPCLSDEQRRNDPAFAGQPRLLDEITKEIVYQDSWHLHESSFAPEDGAPRCDCDLCRKTSTQFPDGMAYGPYTEHATSQEYFTFINQLLEATAQKCPGHIISTNGYINRFPPPELGKDFNRHKNLIIMFADILGCSMHGYDDPHCWQNRQQFDYLKRWCKLCDKVWVFGYNYSLVNTMGVVTPMTKRAIRTIPLTKAVGAIGFNDLDCPDFVKNAIASYVVRFALEWNAKADMKAVLADFYGKWFGPAGKPMQDYYDRLEDAFDKSPLHASNFAFLPSVYKPELMAALANDMAQAEAAAVTDADKLHVRLERLQFDHLRMYVEFLQAQREYRFKDAAKLARDMQSPRNEMHRITPFAGISGIDYGGMAYQADRMTRYASMEMLAPLPEMARFRTDKKDAGRAQRWMEPDYSDSKWQLASTTAGWQNQRLKDEDGLPMMASDGYPYTGIGWYRFTVDVPAVPQGKEAHLFLPMFVSQAWAWVNGEYIGRTDYEVPFLLPQEMDVKIGDFLKPGKNVIAVRVQESNPYIGADGIYERPFLYTKAAN